jgi:hypothetical protein
VSFAVNVTLVIALFKAGNRAALLKEQDIYEAPFQRGAEVGPFPVPFSAVLFTWKLLLFFPAVSGV